MLCNQEKIYDTIGIKVLKNALQGYNNTVFSYGQTGAGKTYTMSGSKLWKERGLIPRFLVDLFKQIKSLEKTTHYEIYISYLEIYNENAYDLLDSAHSEEDIENWKKIIIYEDNFSNIVMKNLSTIKVDNEHQALDLLMTGNYIRHVSSTPMNLASSRSHAIFSIIIEGRDINTEIVRASKINLVDLAGSERLKFQVDQSIMHETKYINLSLSFLEQVIIALNEKCEKNRYHIPYRNSLMTTILKDSLGGNCQTILIANINMDINAIDETLSTLRFAIRCAKVENEIRVNEHMDMNILVTKLNSENEELRLKLKDYENNNAMKYSGSELSLIEKDECKVLISDYLNKKTKKINAKSTDQLNFIIDFLIEYINNKERVFKEKILDANIENKRLRSGSISRVIEKKGLDVGSTNNNNSGGDVSNVINGNNIHINRGHSSTSNNNINSNSNNNSSSNDRLAKSNIDRIIKENKMEKLNSNSNNLHGNTNNINTNNHNNNITNSSNTNINNPVNNVKIDIKKIRNITSKDN